MIQTHLTQGGTTAEEQAVQVLRDALEKDNPLWANDPGILIHLIPSIKCFQSKVSDIDVLLLADFGKGRPYSLPFPFRAANGDEMEGGSDVMLYSLAVVIEVKDQTPSGIHFVGGKVLCDYPNEPYPKDVSDQSNAQRGALAKQIKHQGLNAPFIRNIIWVRNVMGRDIPPDCANVIGSNMTWSRFVQVCVAIQGPYYNKGKYELDDFYYANNFDEIAEQWITKHEPTALDRARMERLSSQSVEAAITKNGLGNRVGTRMLRIRGKGGTGKTVLLLQLAKYLQEKQGARILLLTYNRALVSDIRRLLLYCQVGTTGDFDDATIQVDTVHSAFLKWWQHPQSPEEKQNDNPSDFEQVWEKAKADMLRWQEAQAPEFAAIRAQATGEFSFVFVDEAQDWFPDEQKLLLGLFGAHKVVVAESVEQLVRTQVPTRWDAELQSDQHQIHNLDICLRMKRNLTLFANRFAEAMSVKSSADFVASEQTVGGNITIIEGDYFAARATHDQLVHAIRSDGNAPVDLLFCVPPHPLPAGEAAHKAIARFTEWEVAVWDGTEKSVRRQFALDPESLRLVQYESCRGLEGWGVVLLDLDLFYQSKVSELRQTHDPATASRLAAQWCLIPLTRAIDRLVVTVRQDSDSPIRRALRETADTYPDFVRWKAF